eukprot:1426489-Prymnesium_polylepis.1
MARAPPSVEAESVTSLANMFSDAPSETKTAPPEDRADVLVMLVPRRVRFPWVASAPPKPLAVALTMVQAVSVTLVSADTSMAPPFSWLRLLARVSACRTSRAPPCTKKA